MDNDETIEEVRMQEKTFVASTVVPCEDCDAVGCPACDGEGVLIRIGGISSLTLSGAIAYFMMKWGEPFEAEDLAPDLHILWPRLRDRIARQRRIALLDNDCRTCGGTGYLSSSAAIRYCYDCDGTDSTQGKSYTL